MIPQSCFFMHLIFVLFEIVTDSQKHIFRYKMCLNETNIFNFYSLKGALLPLRPTHYAKPYNEGLQCFAHSCNDLGFYDLCFKIMRR